MQMSIVRISSYLLTENDVSARLHISVDSLRRWRLEKRGPTFFKVGSLVRYRPEDLEQWLLAQPTGGTQVAKGPDRAVADHEPGSTALAS
jgi:helix-turn-helix protein